MAGVPREYLTLVKTGGSFNFSQWGGEWSPPINTVTTHYTKIRLDPARLLVDIGDQTFATSVGSDCCIGSTVIRSLPYASASDCLFSFADTGRANVDLTGLPFIVNDTFVVRGANPKGSVNGSVMFGHGSQQTVSGQIVNLTGGGFCGGIHPEPAREEFPLNSGNLPWLQLQYVGQ
jgi:hypothetical protein